ncbi:uncharacterized protein B0T15DRAFT_173000 [Chaetomium strumarium]|uniref:Sister chromatid cohesion protein DCC1 n=1 Tax=Chaetomium strumarium TaxID=1170767 RepID=A0AAJ0GWI9_9PEZI|nr:hypothetical protein B0T15DRAFT_173000 [Chaetomium strumarium]
MSSQSNTGIPLSHALHGAAYKLLELPPELLELLESGDPPILTLHPSETAALLKTPSKTYSLRQKNTSNALILLSPQGGGGGCPRENDANPSDHHCDGGNGARVVPHTGLTAIATVHETIELVPEADVAAVTGTTAAPKARGKWHEKFGKGR